METTLVLGGLGKTTTTAAGAAAAATIAVANGALAVSIDLNGVLLTNVLTLGSLAKQTPAA